MEIRSKMTVRSITTRSLLTTRHLAGAVEVYTAFKTVTNWPAGTFTVPPICNTTSA